MNLTPLHDVYHVKPNVTTAGFIGELLHSVAAVHSEHLMTTSYARHMALGDYYTGMPDLVDAFAEACISRGDMTINPVAVTYSSVESLLTTLRNNGSVLHDNLSHPDLTNALEDIMTFISSILYKLRLS